jgi:hypothetical protein
MQTVKYVHWQDGDWWLGYLQDYPDYWTQGETLDDLIDHLKDLYLDLAAGQVRPAGSCLLNPTGIFLLSHDRTVSLLRIGC